MCIGARRDQKEVEKQCKISGLTVVYRSAIQMQWRVQW